MAQYKLTFWQGHEFPICEYCPETTVRKDHEYRDGNSEGDIKRRHKSLRGLKSSVIKTCDTEINRLHEEIQEYERLKKWAKELTEEDFKDE